jgi:hypothetical protein
MLVEGAVSQDLGA